MARKAARGTGTIRKKTVTRGGKQYTYWEARYTEGVDPGTGRQIQRSVTGKTQKEVAQKLKAATSAIDQGTYVLPNKMTVGTWLDLWAADYLNGVKPNTIRIYTLNIKKHIKPALGAIALQELRPHMVQQFVNGIPLSPASVRLAYKVLHQALEKAMKLEYIARNPAAGCKLPKLEKREIKPLEDAEVIALLNAAQGTELETLVTVALFTGCRLSELLGLTWDCIDFKKGTITISKQLARSDQRKASPFISPKNGKIRVVTPAVSVLAALKSQRSHQITERLKAGQLWENENNLVFTDRFGGPIDQWKVEIMFHKILSTAGLEGVRFHDLRHTYAVNAIRAGDDIKSIQSNLGHASAAFTLDRYGHFTEQMKVESAYRMEHFIRENIRENKIK